MASPPPPTPLSALSPPPLPSPTLPSKKRPRAPGNTTTSQNKRRKPSTASSVTVPTPLRQISIPPDGSTTQITHRRAPSVNSSVVSGSKRGRKSKGKGKESVAGDAKSVLSTGTPGKSDSGARSANGRADDGDGDDDEDEDGDDGEGGEVQIQGSRSMDEAQERERQKILVAHFSLEQQTRWEAYRRVKPSPKTIKAIANRTLSQSIPSRVAISLNGMTKSYAGNIIERAREIQKEWAEAASSLATPEKEEELPSQTPTQTPTQPIPESQQSTLISPTSPDLPSSGATEPQPEPPQVSAAMKEAALGPLLPEHLREAVRRHKNSVEGGGAGARGLSLASGFHVGVASGMGGSVEFVAPARARRGGGRLFR